MSASASEPQLLPLFLRLAGRRVLVVGGGRLAAQRVAALVATGADVTVVSPAFLAELEAAPVRRVHRGFEPADLDGAWLAVAAAPPEVNRAVAVEAERRRIFVNAIDDVAAATAYGAGVIRRDGVTIAISTEGRAPALAGLLREGIEALLPERLSAWVERAEVLRARWKGERVPMAARRPRLLEALVALHGDSATRCRGWGPGEPPRRGGGAPSAPEKAVGLVSLVGAGPGDPGLLTRRAVERLAEADLVLHDALVPREILALAAPRARRFLVGKRAGRPSVRQETIHRILVHAARAGRRVVRLKAGDPFVLGRGGEEVLALAEAGIPHEVVPGVSAALAAPALAGIPLTHRGLAAAFTVVSGHAEEAFAPVLDAAAPGAATLVVLMGLGTRARIAARLLARGWPGHTPAAVLLAASTPEAATWMGTLAGLGAAPVDGEGRAGTIVIGRVVELAAAVARAERGAAEAAGRTA